MRRALVLALVALLAVGVLPVNAAPGAPQRQPAPGPAPQHDEQLSGAEFVTSLAQGLKNPRLASSLARVGQQARGSDRSAALSQAQASGLEVRDERVRVTIQADGAGVDAAQSAVTRAGGTVETSAGGRVQALVPPDQLEQVASAPGVQSVQPARRLFPTAVAGEEVTKSGADGWQNVGAAGAGVKIAVLDGDFQGYQTRQANGDLPQGLTTKNFCADGFDSGLDGGHGTAVAEIVYEMAPGAQLYLVCAGTLTEMVSAVQYLVDNHIQIVNHSRGIFNMSRADGVHSDSDPAYLPESLITKAYNAGILWVNSAGNSATTHWSGTFRDDDSDGVLNFTAADEGNNITIPTGGTVSISLKWDKWPTTTEDFDLYLARQSNGQVLAFSVDDQTGGAAPIENLIYRNTTGANLDAFISIVRYRATTSPDFDLFVEGNTSVLQYQVAARSLTDFAVSPRGMSVGAACWQPGTTIESYSSRGPTINPDITGVKPDITGLDSVSSATYGTFDGTCGSANGFAGTSASAPHVAGAAALVKDANPSFTHNDIKTFLKSHVVDAGTSGADTTYGSGILALGTLTTAASPTCTVSPRIRVQSTVESGALSTTVTANGASNSLLRVVFGNGSRQVVNAVLSFSNGNPLGSGGTPLYAQFGSTQATFRTQRQSTGAVTVPFVAYDRCGPWPSFVGGGPSAGF